MTIIAVSTCVHVLNSRPLVTQQRPEMSGSATPRQQRTATHSTGDHNGHCAAIHRATNTALRQPALELLCRLGVERVGLESFGQIWRNKGG